MRSIFLLWLDWTLLQCYTPQCIKQCCCLQAFHVLKMCSYKSVYIRLCTHYFWSSARLIRCATWKVFPSSATASEACRACCKHDWLETNLDCSKAVEYCETGQSHRSDQSGKWVGERDTRGSSPGFPSVMTAELGVEARVERCKGT